MRIFLISFLLLFGKTIYGQINIVSGVPSPHVNFVSNGGVYNLYGSSFSAADIGTNVYLLDIGGLISSIPDHYIYRSAGIWKIVTFMFGTFTTTYEYSTPSTSIDPPCTGLWKRFGNVGTTSVSYFPTGILDFLTLSGSTCVPGTTPIGCTSLLCDYIQLAQKSTAQLNAIPTPSQGMFSYDAYKNAPSWYDGGTWKTVYNGAGDFSIGGNMTVTNNLNIAGITNTNQMNNIGLLKNNGNIKIDQASGVNKLSFLSAGVYEHEIYANSPTSMVHTIDGTTYMEIGNNGLVLPFAGITTNSLSTFNSGIKYPITNTTSSITLNSNNYMIVFTGTTATCSFPVASISNKGQVYKIINHGSGSVSLVPSVLTGGVSISSMLSNSIVEVISDGINWRKIN
jgi:hypothetical protein